MNELLSIFLSAASVDFGEALPSFSVYSIAGTIFRGVAVVLLLAAAAHAISGAESIITEKHIDRMCKIILVSGTIVGYAYCMEVFMASYSGSKYEGDAFLLRARYGPSPWYYYVIFFCNALAPQIFWFRKARRNLFWVLLVSISVNIGGLCERFLPILPSIVRDFGRGY